MNTQTRREIRLGLIALVLSGLLLTLGIPLRGPIPITNPEAIIQTSDTPGFVPGWILILVGGMLHTFGTFGLYRYLTYQSESRIAFLALVLRIAAISLAFPLSNFFVVSMPGIAELYRQGNHAVSAIVEANLASGLGLVLLAIGGVTGLPGTILFGIAIWKHPGLPKWTGVLYGVSALGLAIPTTTATEGLGALLLLISSSATAWKGWQESAPGDGT
jgi:hypothetical protein